MDEKTFLGLLAKYPIKRSSTAELPRVRRGGSRSGAGRSSGAAAALPAGSAALGSAAPIVAADFWAGLTPFLERHYGAAGAKAVSAAFDTLHYASLRALNFEDIEDLSALGARELALDAAAAAAAGAAPAAATAE